MRVDGERAIARREMQGCRPGADPSARCGTFPTVSNAIQNITFIPPSDVHIRIEATPAGANDDPDLVHDVGAVNDLYARDRAHYASSSVHSAGAWLLYDAPALSVNWLFEMNPTMPSTRTPRCSNTSRR